MRRLIGEFLRFGGVGLLATATHALVYLVTLDVLVPQLANLIGYGIAVGISYLGHGRFSFSANRTARRHRDQIWRFLVASLLGFGLNVGFVALCTHFLSAPELAFWFIGGVTPVLMFLMLKFWVYRVR